MRSLRGNHNLLISSSVTQREKLAFLKRGHCSYGQKPFTCINLLFFSCGLKRLDELSRGCCQPHHGSAYHFSLQCFSAVRKPNVSVCNARCAPCRLCRGHGSKSPSNSRLAAFVQNMLHQMKMDQGWENEKQKNQEF